MTTLSLLESATNILIQTFWAGDTHLRASARKSYRTYWTVEIHWRSDAWDRYRWHRADDEDLLAIASARARRWNWAEVTHLRASAGRRHRTYWTVEVYWRSGASS